MLSSNMFFVKTILFLKIITIIMAEKKGTFKLTIVSAESCREVEKPYKNVNYNMTMDSNGLISVNYTAKALIGPVNGILTCYKYAGAKKIKMFSYVQKPVCTHIAILKAWPVKMDFDAKCNLKPISVTVKDISLDDVVHKIAGSKFFYGKYLIHYVWETPTETVGCGEYIFKFIPA